MTMSHIDTVMTVLHAVGGLVVLAEGLNKLERFDPRLEGLTQRQQMVVVLKGLGWTALVLGAAGALASPLLPDQKVHVTDLLTMAGFAALVLRSRLRETVPGQPPIASDEFERTQVLRRGPR
jgi:uncharacterized membrane protein